MIFSETYDQQNSFLCKCKSLFDTFNESGGNGDNKQKKNYRLQSTPDVPESRRKSIQRVFWRKRLYDP